MSMNHDLLPLANSQLIAGDIVDGILALIFAGLILMVIIAMVGGGISAVIDGILYGKRKRALAWFLGGVASGGLVAAIFTPNLWLAAGIGAAVGVVLLGVRGRL